MGRAPPVARLACASACGAALGISGAPIWIAPLLGAVWAAAPGSSSLRPRSRWLLAAAAVLAALHVRSAATATPCGPVTDSGQARVVGRFLAEPRGGSAPFEPLGGCRAVTVVVGETDVRAGEPVLVDGRWRAGRVRPWLLASRVRRTEAVPASSALQRLRWAGVRVRADVGRQIDELYGEWAGLVSALTLARREGLDREVREAFARAGIAHLLAISGFHVGVVAALAYALARLARRTRRRSGLVAAAAVSAYVLFIGAPAAATRAAALLCLLALSRALGRPPTRWGSLGTALILFLVLDPGAVAGAGFQLSFLGAAGLLTWAGPWSTAIAKVLGPRCPRALATATAAGAAATLATLPVVAWHFERVSIVGIPATLLAAPLVSAALPGALATLALEPVAPSLARWLASGVELLLRIFEDGAVTVARLHWASVPVARGTVIGGMVGVAVATWAARRPGVGARGRRALVLGYVVLGTATWPALLLLHGWGRLEVLFIDVGQGDAIAIKSPRGRWVLVDAGPPARSGGGEHPVAAALRARGVSRIEALVLTHPDLDHIGGAPSIIEAFGVGAVWDPALPAGKPEYRELLRLAGGASVPWIAARGGMELELDGVTLEVLHPVEAPTAADEVNEASVVLFLDHGDFELLLTGDAGKDVERAVSRGLGGVEVLKLGHHGSDTSTDPLLLERLRPRTAIVSVGRGNRYGHPSPAVVERLRSRGVPLRRTDREGTIRVVARSDGEFTVRTEREADPARR